MAGTILNAANVAAVLSGAVRYVIEMHRGELEDR